ncbi:HTH-type transcriptional repressor FabR [Marinicella sp. S1101]|uniref:HTH-type transcriptional repressor FabR n=1 Tax=Marinicella marina TaxID=2996016 RepID=UPI002260875A|nr:HTH-type transcriptional repressor FabR [Marinicella marina]MCX7553845.1 HTH-type transcriptional repressor FabR [Marinicella marina]MDJ1140921.1 HTH-type transcriptional repressor FabR [Marinicella marina]
MTLSRSQQKERTRRAIIDAAIGQLGESKSFASLSLREVAREAGIAPTSFYRHFKDMEELGLTLVDESGLALRQVMRKARQRIKKKGSVIASSVSTFMEFTQANPNIFRILFHERSGTTRALRVAVAREIQYFVVELTDYIQTAGFNHDSAYAQAEAMVAVIFNAGAESIASKPNQRQQLQDRAITQLRYIAAGAADLEDHS